MGNKIQEIRELLSDSSDYAYDVIAERGTEYLSYLLTELDAAKERLDNQRAATRLRQNHVEGLQAQLDAAKQENERLTSQRDTFKRLANIFENDTKYLQQQLKQAIEALEEIQRMSSEWKVYDAAKEALSLIREEANPHTAPAFGSADSVETEKG